VTWLRSHAGPLLLIYVVVLAVVLLSPSNSVQSDAVNGGAELLQRLGLQNTNSLWRWVEFGENVLIIAPVTFFASLLRPRYSWLEWTALGFLAALLVEVIQAVALPDRRATYSDIVANTLGALLGALVVRLLSRTRR
jgi:glycopeptide antibiotics resistance protein